MRKFLIATVALASVGSMAVSSAVEAAPSAAVVSAARAVTNERVYGSLYGHYKAKYPNALDWNNNGCSVPAAVMAVRGMGAVIQAYGGFFEKSCDRHDFGYRNHDISGASRSSVDARFRANMDYQCIQKDWPGPDVIAEQPCLAASATFYGAVRAFGGGHWN